MVLMFSGSPAAQAALTETEKAEIVAAVKAELQGSLPHYFSVKSDNQAADSNYNNDGATGNNSIAIGPKAATVSITDKVTSAEAIAVGNESNARGDKSIALGSGALTGEKKLIENSVQRRDDSPAMSAISIGTKANARTDDSISIGSESMAGVRTSDISTGIAIGKGAKAVGTYDRYNNVPERADAGIAIGTSSTASRGAVALGLNTLAGQTNAITIGTNAKTVELEGRLPTDGKSHPVSAIAMGAYAEVKGRQSLVLGSYAVAGNGKGYVGSSTTLLDFNGVALGHRANVSTTGSVALGGWSKADRPLFGSDPDQAKVAPYSGQKLLGTEDLSNFQPQYAQGEYSLVYGTVSVGGVYTDHGSNTPFLRQIIGLADGTEDTDAVNLRQLRGAVAQAGGVHYLSVKSTHTGAGSNYDNDGATGVDSIAIGPKVRATKGNSVAIGSGSTSETMGSTVIGQSSKSVMTGSIAYGHNVVLGTASSVTDASKTNVIGFQNAVTGSATENISNQSSVIGSENTATKYFKNSILMGMKNKSDNVESSFVMGNTNTITGSKLDTLGFSGRQASLRDTIVLGTSNTATDARAVSVIGGGNNVTNSYSSSMTGISNTLTNASASSIIGISNTITMDDVPGVFFGTPSNDVQNNIIGVSNKIENKMKENTIIGSKNTLSGTGGKNFVAGFGNSLGANLQNNQIVGSGIKVAASVQNGVALGSGSSLNVSSAVALGSSSVADRAGYTAETIAPFSKQNLNGITLGALSVGTIGKLRQIINVGDGVADTDAVNIRQLKAVDAKIAALPTDDGLSVKYDSTNKDIVTLGGAGSTKLVAIKNVAAGVADTDAVNVAQLKNATVRYFSVNDTIADRPIPSNWETTTNINNDTAWGKQSIAIGRNAASKGEFDLFVGNNAGYNNTATVDTANNNSTNGQNVGIGSYAGQRMTGSRNTSVGFYSGTEGSGFRNTSVGNESGRLVTGNNNLSLGFQAGNQTNGSANVATGFMTGQGVNGQNNIASGYRAGSYAEGTGNLALGAFAGTVTKVDSSGNPVLDNGNVVQIDETKKVVGNANVALGFSAGGNVVGAANISMGLVAGQNVKGSDNIAMGQLAGHGIQGDKNIVMGYMAGVNTNTGAGLVGGSNVVIGDRAGAGLTASNTVALGAQSKTSAPGGVALGYASVADRKAFSSPGVKAPFSEATLDSTNTLGAVSVGAGGNKLRQITNLADGTEGTDAVNLRQLKAVDDRITQLSGGAPTVAAGKNISIATTPTSVTVSVVDDPVFNTVQAGDITVNTNKAGTINNLTNRTWNAQSYTNGQAATEDQLKAVDDRITQLSGGTKAITAGKNISITTGQTDVTVSVVDNPEFTTVKAGDITVNNDGRISGLKDGIADSDAATVGQVKKAISTISGGNWGKVMDRMNGIDRRISSVGAMAAAFSALMPLDYDEEHPTMFSVGFGHYSGQNSIALGVQHYANRDLLFNGGVAWSNDEKMFRLGATWRMGRSEKYETTRVSATELKALRRVDELEGQMKEVLNLVGEMARTIEELKAK